MAKSLLIDITKCVGCGECSRVCAEVNNLSKDESGVLNGKNYTAVKQIEDSFVRKLCMHCESPTCVSVCLVGAMKKQSNGAVTYDYDKCIGCRYCIQACPFDIPKYEWNKTSPSVMKCKLCFERIELGKRTSCADACQFGATIFGERNDLIYEAKKRIAENPTEYINYIYGIKEAGGTSVLYISKVPFERLGFPVNVSKDAIPNLSWAVLSKIPKFAVVTGVVLFGIHWITARRMEIHRMEQLEKEKRMK